MLVIHGVWADDALRVWAEDSERPAARAGRPAAREQRRDGALSFARPHPFAAAAGALGDALAELPEATDVVRKATEDELTLWLPGSREGPTMSPEAASTVESADAAATGVAGEPAPTSVPADAADSRPRPDATAPAGSVLAPWQVPALSFEPGPALALLRTAGQPDARLTDGVLAGSVHYLAALAALAADLATRGRVLPGLQVGGDGSHAARW
ncbi:MAG: hypothetical protein J2P28_17210, partial [Actinobacteria bacterium]|nr:hypothetical protein [Actinomycetota bacterium]